MRKRENLSREIDVIKKHQIEIVKLKIVLKTDFLDGVYSRVEMS